MDKLILKEKYEFLTEIKQGAVLNTPRSLFHLAKFENCKVRNSVEPLKRKRTIPQNDTWHGIHVPQIAAWFAYSMTKAGQEDCCRDVKDALGYCRREKSPFGKEKLVCVSTAHMSIEEMIEFTAKARELMLENTEGQLVLIDPDPAKSKRRLVKEPMGVR